MFASPPRSRIVSRPSDKLRRLFTLAKASLALALLFTLGIAPNGLAENGYGAWLRYTPQSAVPPFASSVVALDRSAVIDSAQAELLRGVRGMYDRVLRLESQLPPEDAIVLGLLPSLARAFPGANFPPTLPADSYILRTIRAHGGSRYTVIAAPDDRGVLSGVFALLAKIQLGESTSELNIQQSPQASIRWVNQWDNLDGSIERGYGGRSIFWDAGHARADLRRVSDYGRLLASIGINGCAISNVNADRRLLSPDYFNDVARIAAALRPWGVQVALSVDFGSPQTIGGLDTFDPVDPRVAQWWRSQADALYRVVPDLAGFVIKADSEGRVGPSFYHRTHADAANVVARALQPHHGLLFYRGFVYDHHMDWRNPKNDRARAAFDNFQKLDGQFDANVMLQVKNGPIDFQVREPVSPLFGSLEKTNLAIELQITQEYMGQAKHLVCLIPQWKEYLDFDLHAPSAPTKKLVKGFVGVANVGLDENWMGNQLSQANLFGFGRLAWNPDARSRAIIDEWTRLTFGKNPKVVQTIGEMQLSSWRTYEDYTGPLGLQTLTDIVGNHYGVSVEASEANGWGQWHRADHQGVGMDRSVATGTGYAGQYRPAVARQYESADTTPDDLLLFFHHVPYTHVLHNGQTVIQYIYDSHYRGAEAVETYVRDWSSLEGLIDEQRFHEVLAQLQYQVGQAELWRDAVSNYFLRTSGIPDAHQRVGHEPDRYEAEAMTLEGYAPIDVNPWETASGGKAVACPAASCSASTLYKGPHALRAIRVRYFDQNSGAAQFRLFLGDQLIDEWMASARPPSAKIDGTTSTVRVSPQVLLHAGDRIRIEAQPDGGDLAALDYIELGRSR
jgi:alpha-glucuronidase